MKKVIDGRVIFMTIIGIIFAYLGFSINAIVGIVVIGVVTLGIAHVIRVNQGKEPLIKEVRGNNKSHDFNNSIDRGFSFDFDYRCNGWDDN